MDDTKRRDYKQNTLNFMVTSHDLRGGSKVKLDVLYTLDNCTKSVLRHLLHTKCLKGDIFIESQSRRS